MTRRTLTLWLTGTMVYLLVLIVLGIWLGIAHKEAYLIFKDLMPLLLALPVAWLSFCFQKRTSFLANLRTLYSQTVSAIQVTIQYTHLSQPDQKDFAKVQHDLSTVIDLFRGSFNNLEEGYDGIGLFPFEALKTIQNWVNYIGFGDSFKAAEASEARRQIIKLWQRRLRPPLLNELDRQRPSSFDSPYWIKGETNMTWPHPPRRRASMD